LYHIDQAARSSGCRSIAELPPDHNIARAKKERRRVARNQLIERPSYLLIVAGVENAEVHVELQITGIRHSDRNPILNRVISPERKFGISAVAMLAPTIRHDLRLSLRRHSELTRSNKDRQTIAHLMPPSKSSTIILLHDKIQAN